MPTYINFGTSVGQNFGNGKVYGMRLGTKTLTPGNLWYTIQSPRNIATSQASGKCQYEPITITKEWGAASPQLLNLLAHGKVLPKLHINFLRTNAKGITQPYFMITLTHVALARYSRNPLQLLSPGHTHYEASGIEQISFTYQAIEWGWGSGLVNAIEWTWGSGVMKVSEDDWEAAA